MTILWTPCTKTVCCLFSFIRLSEWLSLCCLQERNRMIVRGPLEKQLRLKGNPSLNNSNMIPIVEISILCFSLSGKYNQLPAHIL